LAELAMWDELKIIEYPDPRLRAVAKPVQAFDESLRLLANRMLDLMRLAQGVGLAAPQVGVGLRLFVMNATGKPEDDRVIINPELFDAEDSEEAEEGCLSLPEIRTNVVRSKTIRLVARDVQGNALEETASGFVARVWQHEHDHLNGILITNHMGTVAKAMHRKKLRELEARYAEQTAEAVAHRGATARVGDPARISAPTPLPPTPLPPTKKPPAARDENTVGEKPTAAPQDGAGM
jgi:peptide deformylase